MKKFVATAILALTAVTGAIAQTWANLPLQAVPLTNAVGVLVHNSGGYAKAYWSNFVYAVAGQIAATNPITVGSMSLAVWTPALATYVTNTTSAFQLYGVKGQCVPASVSGQVKAVAYLWTTNQVAIQGQTTVVGSLVETKFFTWNLAIPPGGWFAISNESSGSGNAVTLFGGAYNQVTFKP